MPESDLTLDINTSLAARRTGMAFQRTRMAADRTLMAIIRTALSLISFGFTIFQIFNRLVDKGTFTGDESWARHFGLALVILGIAMLVIGIAYHIHYMIGLRRLRSSMREEGLIYGTTIFPVSLTLVTAVALLAIGIAAIAGMLFQIGPLG